MSATCTQPSGNPASLIRLAKRSAHSGVTDAGFIITGQPVATAGIT
ncbi:hypothetical protein MNB_SUP05-7-994 [hydrothermal vent metagenome]|uniref:Uncharacterized protein n=1 Tax=hydrothermal vent metagenome TaxID=652676 RepID=A0A1W1DPN8_9ZZZZ